MIRLQYGKSASPYPRSSPTIGSMIRSLLANTFLLTSIALMVLFGSLAYDLVSGESNLFHRSGGPVAVVGAFLGLRRVISQTFDDAVDSEYIIDGGNASTDFDEIRKDAARNVIAAYIGLVLVVVGTIVGSYGDILLGFFD